MDRKLTSHPAAGFSLIELMVVVAVLALLTTSVTLSFAQPERSAGDAWARFAALHADQRSRALLTQRLRGLRLSEQGVQPLVWAGTGWTDAGPAVAWSGPVERLDMAGGAATLIFAPSGQSTPVRIRFGTGTTARLCVSDGWADLACVPG